MKLIVGLGNPGAKYAANRHNVGWMAVDRIVEDHGLGPWRARFQGQVAEGRLGSGRVVLLKPETFMNLSGQSVGEAMRFYKIEPADVVVVHDEIDLAPGRLKWKLGGGHAGHNGLRSLHAHIGDGYGRVRIGVGHPGHKDAVAGWVLKDFAKADEGWLDDLLRGISDGAPALADGDAPRFQNAVALRMQAGEDGAAAPSRTAGAAKGAPPEPGADKAEGAPPERGAEPAPTPLQRLLDRFR